MDEEILQRENTQDLENTVVEEQEVEETENEAGDEELLKKSTAFMTGSTVTDSSANVAAVQPTVEDDLAEEEGIGVAEEGEDMEGTAALAADEETVEDVKEKEVVLEDVEDANETTEEDNNKVKEEVSKPEVLNEDHEQVQKQEENKQDINELEGIDGKVTSLLLMLSQNAPD